MNPDVEIDDLTPLCDKRCDVMRVLLAWSVDSDEKQMCKLVASGYVGRGRIRLTGGVERCQGWLKGRRYRLMDEDLMIRDDQNDDQSRAALQIRFGVSIAKRQKVIIPGRASSVVERWYGSVNCERNT